MNKKIKHNPLVIVLVEPSGAINLGSIARLCANYEIAELRIVGNSCDPDHPEARKMAIKGKEFLEKSQKFDTLVEALADCHRVIATCGRIHHGTIPIETTEKALPWFMETISTKPIAIIFGRESRGLTNYELQLAHKVITLNSSANYPSLNLSHAVGIVLHEVYQYKNKAKKVLSINSHTLSSPKQLNDLILDAKELLLGIGFLFEHTANARMSKVKSLLNRAEIRPEEVALIRGMLRQIRWALSSNKS